MCVCFLLPALLLLVTIGAARADVAWQTDYDAARRLAQRTGKPLLVDFFATWCGPCKEMERTTFHDPAVRKLMARCVCVRVDVDRVPALAQKFGVNSIPRLLVINPRGRRLMDALGYRPPDQFREDLASALGGKPVIESNGGGAGQSPIEPPGIANLRAMVESGRYETWKKRSAAAAARARRQLVEQLGAFDASDRDRAAALLARLGDDAVTALIAALDHPKLAIRVAASDALTRLLTNRYSLPPATQPHYDAWAAAPERARMARAWSQWWTQRRRTAPTGTL